jgi:hypothetical protein
MTAKEAYHKGYNSGWKMKFIPLTKEIKNNQLLYDSYKSGQEDGYSDWKYECQSEAGDCL